MKLAKRTAKRRRRRSFRVRNRVRRTVSDRPRLSVYRSGKHMYAQIIDDAAGRTLVAASTVEKTLGGAGRPAGNTEAAAKVGALLAQRAVERGVQKVVFDRGSYRYHGRVRALAEAAREGGLQF